MYVNISYLILIIPKYITCRYVYAIKQVMRDRIKYQQVYQYYTNVTQFPGGHYKGKVV